MDEGRKRVLLIAAAISVGSYFTEDSLPIEDREKLADAHLLIMSMHLGRAATILLCIVTELQAKFRFDDDGAKINQRISEMWNALMPLFEAKELYVKHYRQLISDRGIAP